MKKILLSALLCAAAGSTNATTLLYLNFDEAAAQTYTQSDSYTVGSTEYLAEGFLGSTAITFRAYPNFAGTEDSAEIGAIPGTVSGTTPQGGQALICDGSGGIEQGLTVEAANTLDVGNDLTLEAIWWTTDAAASGNTVGIQSVIGNEWPGEPPTRAQFFIRTVGDQRFDYWTDRGDSDGENVQITGAGAVVANTLYHDVLVFDYNDSDPANSTIIAYRNGSQVGTDTYDATDIEYAYFTPGFNNGDGNNPSTNALAIGMALSAPIDFGDDRGLRGGIDAIAVSNEALAPADFVLPTGNIAAQLNADKWDMYE